MVKSPKWNEVKRGHWGLYSLLTLLSCLNGCSLCCNPYIDDYGTFGSRTPRTDMKHGRVGSIFSDPNAAGLSDEVVVTDEGAFPEEMVESVDGVSFE